MIDVLEQHDFNKRPGEYSLFKYEWKCDKEIVTGRK